jgi:hypothetical protein
VEPTILLCREREATSLYSFEYWIRSEVDGEVIRFREEEEMEDQRSDEVKFIGDGQCVFETTSVHSCECSQEITPVHIENLLCWPFVEDRGLWDR